MTDITFRMDWGWFRAKRYFLSHARILGSCSNMINKADKFNGKSNILINGTVIEPKMPIVYFIFATSNLVKYIYIYKR